MIASDASTWEAEADRVWGQPVYTWVPGQPGLLRETLSWKTKTKTKKHCSLVKMPGRGRDQVNLSWYFPAQPRDTKTQSQEARATQATAAKAASCEEGFASHIHLCVCSCVLCVLQSLVYTLLVHLDFLFYFYFPFAFRLVICTIS